MILLWLLLPTISKGLNSQKRKSENSRRWFLQGLMNTALMEVCLIVHYWVGDILLFLTHFVKLLIFWPGNLLEWWTKGIFFEYFYENLDQLELRGEQGLCIHAAQILLNLTGLPLHYLLRQSWRQTCEPPIKMDGLFLLQSWKALQTEYPILQYPIMAGEPHGGLQRWLKLLSLWSSDQSSETWVVLASYQWNTAHWRRTWRYLVGGSFALSLCSPISHISHTPKKKNPPQILMWNCVCVLQTNSRRSWRILCLRPTVNIQDLLR